MLGWKWITTKQAALINDFWSEIMTLPEVETDNRPVAS
jgi:hypothetical protein